MEGLNKAFTDKDAPENWVISETRMIKKNSKPTTRDFRPIALGDVSSKLHFSFIKRGIEEHLINSNMVLENQIGFTEGGRTEYCHFLLQYMVEKTFNSAKKCHNKLIIVALDFKKAFDSIDRRRMIETLIKYKIHPHVIDLIAKINSQDETIVKMGDREEKMKVTTGIKQGCTASTVLFKIITFEIMRKLDEEGDTYEIDGIKMRIGILS